MPRYRNLGRTLSILLVFLMINIQGCSKRYIIVDGMEQVTITKSELDRLYTDNEMLLKELEGCK